MSSTYFEAPGSAWAGPEPFCWEGWFGLDDGLGFGFGLGDEDGEGLGVGVGVS
ncbi:MAG: hypothetical protein ACRDKS_12675 [Actinomycetota bacterium]